MGAVRQAMGDNRAMEYMRGRRIMEINPDSPVIAQLKRTFEEAPASPAVSEAVELLYETALLTSGFAVDSTKDFAARCALRCNGRPITKRFRCPDNGAVRH